MFKRLWGTLSPEVKATFTVGIPLALIFAGSMAAWLGGPVVASVIGVTALTILTLVVIGILVWLLWDLARLYFKHAGKK